MKKLRCTLLVLLALGTIVAATADASTPLFITTTQLPPGTLNMPYQAPLNAKGGVPPFTWSILSGELPPGLTLVAGAGVITGTPTEAGTFSFAVQVSDRINERARANLQITINGGVNDGALNGHYALELIGFTNGMPFIMAGAFVADGAGNIIAGYIDLNDSSGEYNDPSQCRGNPYCPIPLVIQSPGSTYDLSVGNGLGTMTIVALDHFGNPNTFQFSIAIPNASACAPSTLDSTCGRIIERDPNNPQTYGSGVLKAQDSTYFQTGNFFPVNFAFQVTGVDPAGHRYSGAGALGTNTVTMIDIDCNGNGWQLPNCPFDIDDNGSAASDPIAGSQFSADIDPNTGRGKFVNMRFPSDPGGICLGGSHPNCGYAYYVVNKQEAFIISSDPLSKPANLTLWDLVRQSQSGGWNLGSLNGVDVIELSAASPSGSGIMAGLLHAQGNGSATLSADENNGGVLSQQSVQQAYTTNSTGQVAGRFTLSGLNGFSTRRVIYLYAPNAGFVVGPDAGAPLGDLRPQASAPFSNSSVSGNYAGGTSLPVVAGVTNSATALLADGAGHITATQYTSGPAGPGGPTNLTLTYQVDATGRAVVQNQSGQEFGVLYVVGPTSFVLLPTGSNPAANDFASGGN
jgi:Putative Ig domain